jgi:hypothetical protein
MLTIIHGSNLVASRKFFLDEKQRFPDAALLREAEVNLTDLAQLLEGGGLFENSKSIFIEQFLTTRRKSAEKETIISYLLKQAKTNTILLWEGKELDRSALALFKNETIKSYKLPSTLFTLLDEIKPDNGARLVQLFHETLETTEAEMVFFMLVRQIRILLALSGIRGDTISEVGRLAPWQKGRFEKQAKLFKRELLRELYSRLFEIEVGQKTGTLSSSLIYTIDFFLDEI